MRTKVHKISLQLTAKAEFMQLKLPYDPKWRTDQAAREGYLPNYDQALKLSELSNIKYNLHLSRAGIAWDVTGIRQGVQSTRLKHNAPDIPDATQVSPDGMTSPTLVSPLEPQRMLELAIFGSASTASG